MFECAGGLSKGGRPDLDRSSEGVWRAARVGAFLPDDYKAFIHAKAEFPGGDLIKKGWFIMRCVTVRAMLARAGICAGNGLNSHSSGISST